MPQGIGYNFQGLGQAMGDPQGRFMQYVPRMQMQVPTLDFQSALKMSRPGFGRSQDAGTYNHAQGQLASSMAQAAQQQSQIPFDMFSRQAQEVVNLGGLQNALQAANIRLRNQSLIPALAAQMGAERSLYGGAYGGALGGALAGVFDMLPGF